MQTAGSVTAEGNGIAQPAACVTAVPDCATQPATAVTPTGNAVIHERSVACHEAVSCVAAAAAHHPPAVAPLGPISLASARHLPAPLPQSGSQLAGGAGRAGMAAGSAVAVAAGAPRGPVFRLLVRRQNALAGTGHAGHGRDRAADRERAEMGPGDVAGLAPMEDAA